jgi:hypothetical protein
MTKAVAIVLAIIAFMVLIGTFHFVSRLRHGKSPRPLSIGKDESGDPFQFRFNIPIVDWIIERERRLLAALPGYYHPIGVLYGLIAVIAACISLVLAYGIASITGLVMGWVGISYSLEGISQALQRRAFLRAPIAVIGLVMGVSVVSLHIAALFGRRLLPTWTL